ncbi:SH3 domain-containing protein [Escovopsis weberi]|uniref:SH3 domain-containing protein n=1 Tax=Escovopsis weberi TaxID=150374 RepID=A0A0N0RU68_ESCWE|nr:SH3 domain-containing protein [Escovopsis weberi]
MLQDPLAFGPDKIIPPSVLSNAKGLAIITVLKAGFLGSGRFGSGLVVARLPDGSWSAPSAIATLGDGFGGQIGFELTDFVFILNDAAAVKTFAQAGSVTLGGNVSLAAGPVGRNAEAAGAASLRSVSGIFSYSKTKGLFAGVSRSNTWHDDVYDQPSSSSQRDFSSPTRSQTFNSPGGMPANKKPAPGRPTGPKPAFATRQAPAKPEAIAMYNFDPDQPGDLGFRKGEIITIVKKTDSENDSWTGRIGQREGIFPSNYVKMRV